MNGDVAKGKARKRYPAQILDVLAAALVCWDGSLTIEAVAGILEVSPRSLRANPGKYPKLHRALRRPPRPDAWDVRTRPTPPGPRAERR